MEFKVIKPGMLTTVQDLGRWGYQSSGVPVAGAMDLPALRMGNAIVGNAENAAALEVTFLGPELAVVGEGLVAFAGADLGFSVNGKEIGSWAAVRVKDGDVLSFKGPKNGCRGYICVSGGIDVPVVMGSRSTYIRAKIGGFEGRALKAGDVVGAGEADLLWKRADGFALPADMRPAYSQDSPLFILTGLQEDAFTEEGLDTLFGSEYVISNESDRMGCRFDGPKVRHKEAGADIVSDAIPLGAVQIPGHGLPIAMLADRQTTGGYTKVGVLSSSGIQALVQRMPGMKARFARATMEQAIDELRSVKETVGRIKHLRAAWVSRPKQDAALYARPLRTELRITVNGKTYDVKCEEIL